jgi:hypothetical protein
MSRKRKLYWLLPATISVVSVLAFLFFFLLIANQENADPGAYRDAVKVWSE